MLTVELLKEYGANTAEGISRCVNNEQFYLRMVKKVSADPNFEALESAIKAHDLNKAFEAAHAIKGITGNLSLDPILLPVKEITEWLRNGEDRDYAPYVELIMEKKRELDKICAD